MMVLVHSYRLSPFGPALQFVGGSRAISANSFAMRFAEGALGGMAQRWHGSLPPRGPGSREGAFQREGSYGRRRGRQRKALPSRRSPARRLESRAVGTSLGDWTLLRRFIAGGGMKRASVAQRVTKTVPAPVVSAIAASARRVTRRSCSSIDAAEQGGEKAQPAEQRPKRSIKAAAPAPAKRPAVPDNNKRAYEAKWWAAGCRRVAGVDEAGRGPLAGPVVAAAVIVPADVHLDGVDDSKVLTEQQREELYELLTTHPRVSWAVSVVEHTVIDDINILQATLRASA